MKIGIGLPNHIAGAPAASIVEWTRRADERGFESVTTIDRLVYPSVDSIVALALAAGASGRLTLVTNILLAPLYPAPLLAKQLGSIAAAAPDRLVVGMGVGSREDDYAAVGADFRTRGKQLDSVTEVLRLALRGEPIVGDTPLCPTPVKVPLLFGGKSKATARRATTIGDGWVAGALRDYPTQSEFADGIRADWKENGRQGDPCIHASVNFAIGGDNVTENGREHLASYYGFVPEYAAMNVADMVTTADDAKATVRAYTEMGFERLLFHPTVSSVDQVDLLADAVL
jgi:alkanesulfonate monooxygenase SsuD/methylene tetrahydromethanopterin reductase-like flavin-dependent oxidoreductase (luciferase family)